MKKKSKNRAAVHLGKLSYKSRLKSLGVKGMSKKMAQIRALQEEKKVINTPFSTNA